MLIDTKDKIETRDANPVYAELSAYNWPLAIYSEILNNYTNDHQNWKNHLNAHFQQVNSQPLKQVLERKVYQNIFHGIVLGSSIKMKYHNNYFNYADIVGTISDFYYAIYNLFNTLSMARDVPQKSAHGKNINIFKSIKHIFPYPFNIYSEFNSSSWDGQKIITNENFSHNLNIVPPTTDASASMINTRHNSNHLSDWQAQDILKGYLRGTVDFYLQHELIPFKKKYSLTKGIRKQVHKDEINPRLQKIEVNFMNCLYRYRTKAHYRDFAFLAYQYQDDYGSINDTMDVEFYKYLYTIIEFAVATATIHTTRRIGKKKTIAYFEDFTKNFKDISLKNDNYWNTFVSTK